MSLWLSSIQSGLDGLPYSWAWTRGRKFSLFQKKKINSKWYFGGGDHDGSVIFMPCSRDVAHIYSETLPDPFSWTSFLKKSRALSSDLASNVEVISKASTRVDRIAWRAKKRSKRAQGRDLFLFARFSALFFGTSAGFCWQDTHASANEFPAGVLCPDPGSWSNNQNGGTLSWMNCFESDLIIIPQTPSLSEKSNGYLTDNDHSLWLTTPNLR